MTTLFLKEPDYIAAYEDALSCCSTEGAPWFVIPANHKWFRNVVVARIVVEYLEAMKLKKPMPSVDLDEIRKEYHTAKEAQDAKQGIAHDSPPLIPVSQTMTLCRQRATRRPGQ